MHHWSNGRVTSVGRPDPTVGRRENTRQHTGKQLVQLAARLATGSNAARYFGRGHALTDAPRSRGLAISSRPTAIKKSPLKITIRIKIGKPHHHHIPRRTADELMA